MSRSRRVLRNGARMLLAAAAVVAAPVLLVTSPAAATAVVSKAQVSGGSLLIEGQATVWNAPITVDGVEMTTSDAAGRFKVSRSGYTPPADCTVDVSDGLLRPTTVHLNGCTATVATPAMLPDSAELGPFPLGAPVSASVTSVVSVPGAIGPLSWRITAGALPAGLSLQVQTPSGVLRDPLPQQLIGAQIVGTPTAAGTSTVTLRATDTNGLTATRTYTVRVAAAVPLSITPEPWPSPVAGEFTNLWIDGAGGVKPYRWTVAGGALPPGMSLVQDVGTGPSVRVAGTSTAAGTYAWALQLTDAQGATVTRAFTATVFPAAQAAPAPDPSPSPSPAPAPAFMSIAGLTLGPAGVVGGSPSIGTVTVSTPAPAGGTAVFLSSSGPGVASVPATVTVPEGATSASFPVSTTAVSTTTVVTIDATYAGTLTARLSVTAH